MARRANQRERPEEREDIGRWRDRRARGKWWDRYWTLRREYEPRGLRWASDYDAQRVRLMVIWKSTDVTVENLNLKRSGFWTVQIVYSDHVTANGT